MKKLRTEKGKRCNAQHMRDSLLLWSSSLLSRVRIPHQTLRLNATVEVRHQLDKLIRLFLLALKDNENNGRTFNHPRTVALRAAQNSAAIHYSVSVVYESPFKTLE